MELSDAEAFIKLVASEYDRRQSLLPENDNSGLAYDQWMFTDLPFLHDLCVLYLIAVRHHIERRLLHFATRATEHGSRIKKSDYESRQKQLLTLPQGKRWKEIEKRLTPNRCARYSSVEALRLLANSYKHDPLLRPDKELLGHLQLDTNLSYAPIPESLALQKGLARVVGLADDAHFLKITQKFIDHTEEFLKDVEVKNKLSTVNWGRFSFADVAH